MFFLVTKLLVRKLLLIRFLQWLYGSETRGEARPDSDIELLMLIDSDNITMKDCERLTTPLYDIELDTGIQINPVYTLPMNGKNIKGHSITT